MAHVTEFEDQAAWLARGYVQGQRDLLLRMIEHRFSTPIQRTLNSESRALRR